MSSSQPHPTFESISDLVNTFHKIKLSSSELVSLMSPAHNDAEEILGRAWDVLHDHLSTSAEPPTEELDLMSNIIHKLRCASSQLKATEVKLHNQGLKHISPDPTHPLQYANIPARMLCFGSSEPPSPKKDASPDMFPGTPNLQSAAVTSPKVDPSPLPVTDSSTQPLSGWEEIKFSPDGTPLPPAHSLEPLKTAKKHVFRLLAVTHPDHRIAVEATTLFWKALRNRFFRDAFRSLHHLNVLSTILHKITPSYCQMKNIELDAYDSIFNQISHMHVSH